jgi:hypothetical protein
MKLLSYPRSLSLVCLIGALSFMSGCSATMSFPDSVEPPTGDFGVTHGGVWGGQQPISGAQVYVFQTNTGSYGATAPTSLLGDTGSSILCTAPSNSTQAKAMFPLVYVSAGLCYYQTGGYNGASSGGAANNYGYQTGKGKVNPTDTNTPLDGIGNGEFNLSNLFKCNVGSNVWLLSLNGFTDTTAADQNPYAGLMADLGPCPSGGTGPFNSVGYVYMNELSTAAFAYAVAGFTGDTTSSSTQGVNIKISTTSTNTLGLKNAFLNSQQLYNIFGLTDQPDLSAPHTTTTGTRNGVPPYELINTVGDALANCINSTNNLAAASSACSNLYVDLYGSSGATDTASAMIHLAKHPNGLNPSALLTLAANDPVWQPYYSSPAPADLSAAISYTGVGTPQGMILDTLGNAYVDNYATGGYMTQLTPLGAVTATTTPAIYQGASLAVDSTGLIWTPSVTHGGIYTVSNTTAPTTVTQVEPDGTLTSQTPPVFPDPVAADGSGYVYIADYSKSGGEIYKISAASGPSTPITGSTAGLAGSGCVTAATGVAVSSGGYLWVTGIGNPDVVCLIANDGSSILTAATTSAGRGGGPIAEADGVAVGKSDSAWVIYTAGSLIYNVTTSGTVTHTTSGGGIAYPTAVTVDGAGNVWTVNDDTSHSDYSISEFNGSTELPISGSIPNNYGFQYGNLNLPSGIGIDISGNVWTSNYGGGAVVEIMGIATPTKALVTQQPATLP